MLTTALQYVGFVLALVGFALLSAKIHKAGQWTCLVADIILIIYGIMTAQYALLGQMLFIVLFLSILS